MTAANVGALLTNTANVLGELMRNYETLAQDLQSTDTTMAEFARFLSAREQQTITALHGYLDRHEHIAALDVHVRLAAGFPFGADDLQMPRHPSLDELIELAERTDTQLGQLSERIQVYAVSGELVESLHALEELVSGRQRELSAALHELESYRPSPRQTHE
jgi:hypothetical protein